MGVMDKFLNYMKLNDEEDEGFYDDDYLDDEEEVEPVKKFSPANRQPSGPLSTLPANPDVSINRSQSSPTIPLNRKTP